MATTDLQAQITAKQKEVEDKFSLYSTAKISFVSTKTDWQAAVSDLEDLKRQQKALSDEK